MSAARLYPVQLFDFLEPKRKHSTKDEINVPMALSVFRDGENTLRRVGYYIYSLCFSDVDKINIRQRACTEERLAAAPKIERVVHALWCYAGTVCVCATELQWHKLSGLRASPTEIKIDAPQWPRHKLGQRH